MEAADKYIDRLYHFRGKWDVPSICGIKIVENPKTTIVIATNLYESNPGTSISRWSAQLAMSVCKNFNIDPGKLVFIERNPDRNSKLDFYKETFDVVEFRWEDDHFTNPVWKRIGREEVDSLIG